MRYWTVIPGRSIIFDIARLNLNFKILGDILVVHLGGQSSLTMCRLNLNFKILGEILVSHTCSTIDHTDEQFTICGCFLSVGLSVSSGYSCHISLDTIENYLILRPGSSATSMASVLPPLLGWQLWLLCGHLDFPCCDPVGGAFFGRGAFFDGGGLPPCHFGSQCPIVLHLEHLESLVGQFVLPVACCHVQLGHSLEGVSGAWLSPLWLVCAPQHISWQIVSTCLELWETCSQVCLKAKWFTTMSVSLLEDVLKDLAISLSRNFPSWQ